MTFKVFLEKDPIYSVESNLILAYDNEQLWEALDSVGIYRVYDQTRADVSMVPASSLGTKISPNSIVLERVDGCQLAENILTSDPRVLSWVKMYRYKEQECYALPCVEGRIFTRHLTADFGNSYHKELPLGFDKVTMGLCFLHYKRHLLHKKIAENSCLDGDRSLDVFFAGTTEYQSPSASISGRLISAHRQDVVNRINSLTNLSTLSTAARSIPQRDYIKTLQNSKITVSPWGWGEACYRDYEALLHGCEVIKPRSYNMFSKPDIYNSKHMTFCNPDWSDLETTIRHQLDTWELRSEQREKSQRVLLDALQYDSQAQLVSKVIRTAMTETSP